MTDKFLTPGQILAISKGELEFKTSSDSEVVDFEGKVIPASNLDTLFSGLKHKPELAVMADAGEVRGSLPQSVDLREWASPVDDQGPDGLCTAYSKIGAHELMLRKKFGLKTNFSEDYLFSTYRQYSAVAAANAICRYFQIPENMWPFQAKQGKPGWEATKHSCLKDWREISTLQAAKERLAEGEPVTLAVGLDVSHWRKPFIPHDKGTQKGGHDVCVVGYVDDARFPRGGYLIIKNSWGTRAGDKGYFYMPYAYITDSIFRAAFIGFSREVVFNGPAPKVIEKPEPAPAKEPPKLQAHLFWKDAYMPEGGKIHNIFGGTVIGPDLENVVGAKWSIDTNLPRVNPVYSVDMPFNFATYARAGWHAGSVEVTLQDGTRHALPVTIPNVSNLNT